MRFLSFCLFATSLAFTSALRAGAQQPAPQPNRLESGRTIERAITSRQVDTFLVALDSGAAVRVAMVQHGIDLVVSVYGPRGGLLAQEDSSDDGPDKDTYAVAVRTGEHRIQIIAYAPRYAALTTPHPGRYSLTVQVLSREQLATLAAADRSRRAAVVNWVSANAVRLKTVDAGHGFADMEPLRAIVGNARVVALGEATHGTHEFFALKHRMLEYLVTKMGFNIFAIEATMPEAFDVNDYVLTGRGDPSAALAGLYFWTWNTEEVLDLIRWMRAWNADPRHIRKLKFYGFDMQFPTRAAKVALAYLRRVDAAQAHAATVALGDVADPFLADNLARISATHSDSLLQAARRLLARFDDHRVAYIQHSSSTEWKIARQHARILVQNLEMTAAGDSGARYRNRVMAENIGWILEKEGHDAKAAVWAHNGHVASHCDEPVWMGCYLRTKLGRDLVIFGFAFNRGGFLAMALPPTPTSALREFHVGPAPDSSLDGTLAEAGLTVAAVDLRSIPDGPVADWFAQSHQSRLIGAGFADQFAASFLQNQRTRQLYDAVLFVDSTTAARERPNGSPPKREVLTAPANLGFEEHTPEGLPKHWYVSNNFADSSFSVALTPERPSRGGWSAVVSRARGVHYGEMYGGLGQFVDASTYRGKWVRLRAMSRADVHGAESRAHLSLLLLTRPGTAGSDSLLTRVVAGGAWRPYEIVAFVPETVATLRYGLVLVGDGKVWLADVSLEVVPKPPE